MPRIRLSLVRMSHLEQVGVAGTPERSIVEAPAMDGVEAAVGGSADITHNTIASVVGQEAGVKKRGKPAFIPAMRRRGNGWFQPAIVRTIEE